MNADQLAAAIAATPGEKVTKEYMESRIVSVGYHQFDATTTICNIALDNGYSVRGESACVDPTNYRREIGEQLAFDNAFTKLWPLFGFLLAERRATAPVHDLLAQLRRQREWSEKTFGPGDRLDGIIDHIKKELIEIGSEEDPVKRLTEWMDVVILGLDGAWRDGASPEEIIAAWVAKQIKNENRKWPDWRTAEHGKAIEHIRQEGE